jgi:two-component system, sensor histidine kinase and response regulator
MSAVTVPVTSTKGSPTVNILLVDDQPTKLLALESVVSTLGENVMTAHSGEEALRHLLNEDFAVILLDVKMPGMNGFELAQLIRQRPRSRYTPILFISAVNTTDAFIFKGYEMGAVDYLPTPAPEILRAKVKVFVELYKKNEEVRRYAEAIHQLNSELERRVAERTAALQRSNEELQQFAYIVSHDLQEPLRTIASYVGLLAERYRGRLEGDADTMIGFVVDGASRMQEQIKGLLTYLRVGNKELERTSTNCEDVLACVVRDLQCAIEDSGAVLTHDTLPTVLVKVNQFTLLLQNLINNAIKFRGEAPPRIHLSARQDGATWVFSVRDNGIGIEPRHAERIFQVFQRLHTRSEYPGTGIGLAICKKIVEQHGGRIWVESTPGEGATFYFSIPENSSQEAGGRKQ